VEITPVLDAADTRGHRPRDRLLEHDLLSGVARRSELGTLAPPSLGIGGWWYTKK